MTTLLILAVLFPVEAVEHRCHIIANFVMPPRRNVR
jgi:hypothetical protein